MRLILCSNRIPSQSVSSHLRYNFRFFYWPTRITMISLLLGIISNDSLPCSLWILYVSRIYQICYIVSMASETLYVIIPLSGIVFS